MHLQAAVAACPPEGREAISFIKRRKTMRLRAGLGLLLLGLGGCTHLPDGVQVDLENGVVEVGPCRCKLPRPSEPVAAPTPTEGNEQPR